MPDFAQDPTRAIASGQDQLIDALCDRFEAVWKSGTPRIEDYLKGVAEGHRKTAFEELLRVEFEIRSSRGEKVAAEEYTERFPAYADEISEAFRQRNVPPAETIAHDSGRRRSGLHVRCPHCHNPIELVPDAQLDDVNCPSCGSNFSLTGNDQSTRDATTITRLGQFELIERIGMGAFGTVWKARDTQLQRIVAIKVPRKGELGPEESEKFFREARSAAQLRHPNIVSVHEVGRDGDSVYIVSDFIRGVPLSEMIADTRLSFRETAELLAKVADALHHAHEAGVVHRDLKPQNIMIDDAGEPHLMDFGLAKREAGEITMTLDGAVLGTPAYMSPEQARGESHEVDRTTDIYSMGVMLFQMLTGELPFRGTPRMLIHKVINDEPPSPRRMDAAIPKDLETITLKCLEKDPSKRYQKAHDLAAELKRFLAGEPIEARPIGRIARSWRWCKRNRAVALLTALVASLLFALGIAGPLVALWQSQLRTAAEQQKQAALEARADAVKERELAKSERDKANSQSYRALISAANASIATKDYATARASLANADAKQRGWEWRYLKRLADLADATIPHAHELWYDGKSKTFLAYSLGDLFSVNPVTYERATIYRTPDANTQAIWAADPTGSFVIQHKSWADASTLADFEVIECATGKRTAVLEPFKPDIERTSGYSTNLFRVSARLGLVAALPTHLQFNNRDGAKSLPIWDLRSGKLVQVIKSDRDGFQWMQVDEARGTILTLSQSTSSYPPHYSIKAWNPRTGTLQASAEGSATVEEICFADADKGSIIASVSASWVTYGPQLGSPISTIKISNLYYGRSCLASANGQAVVAGYPSGKVVSISADGKTIEHEFLGHGSQVARVAVAPDTGAVAALADNVIRVWSRDDNRNDSIAISYDYEDDIEFAPTMGLAIVAHVGKNELQALDITCGAEVWRKSSFDATSLAIDSRSSLIACGTMNGEVVLLDSSGNEVRRGHAVTGSIQAIAWSADSHTLAVGSEADEVALLDSQSLQPIWRRSRANNRVTKLAIDEQHNVLFVGYDSDRSEQIQNGTTTRDFSAQRLACLDIASGDVKWSWPVDKNQQESLFETPSERLSDLRLLESKGWVCAAIGDELRLFDAATGKPVWNWNPGSLKESKARTFGLRCKLAVEPKSKRILFAPGSGTLYVLEPLSANPLITIAFPDETSKVVAELAIDPSSSSLYACAVGRLLRFDAFADEAQVNKSGQHFPPELVATRLQKKYVDAVERQGATVELCESVLAEWKKLVADRPAVAIYRKHLADSHADLAYIFGRSKDSARARANYEEALRIRTKLVADFPGNRDYIRQLSASQFEYGQVHRLLGDDPSALQQFELWLAMRSQLDLDHPEATEYSRDEISNLNRLAWLLATSVDDEVRDGKRAVELASKACEMNQYNDPRFIDTLAAAYAETGDFTTAAALSESAISMIHTPAADSWRERFAGALANYKVQKPTRLATDIGKSSTPNDNEAPELPSRLRAPDALSESIAWRPGTAQGIADVVRIALALPPEGVLSNEAKVFVGEWLILGEAPQKAIPLLAEAIKHGFTKTYVYKSYGWALQAAGRKDEARAAFEKSIGNTELNEADLDQWVPAYFLDRVSEQQFLERASQNHPPADAFAWLYIGQRREKEDTIESAIDAYQKSVAASESAAGVAWKRFGNWSAYRLAQLKEKAAATAESKETK